jgi:hypothetical protein
MGASVTLAEKIGLVISVDQRHGTKLDGYCVCTFYTSVAQVGSYATNTRSLYPFYTVPVYVYIFHANSDCLFFLYNLKISHMMEFQFVHYSWNWRGQEQLVMLFSSQKLLLLVPWDFKFFGCDLFLEYTDLFESKC